MCHGRWSLVVWGKGVELPLPSVVRLEVWRQGDVHSDPTKGTSDLRGGHKSVALGSLIAALISG